MFSIKDPGSLFFLVVTLSLVSIFQHYALRVEGSGLNSNVIVEFNPYISVLDKWDRTRYNITQLLPLIAKVATEFNRVFINIGDAIDYAGVLIDANLRTNVPIPPYFYLSSVLLSPLAFATFNSHHNGTQPKIEVWLYAETNYQTDACSIFSYHLLKYIAETTNNIFEGTVTTLLFPFYPIKINKAGLLSLSYPSKMLMEVCKRDLVYDSKEKTTRHYNCGLVANELSRTQAEAIFGMEEMHYTDVILLHLSNLNLHSQILTKWKQCRRNNGTYPELGFFLSTFDTGKDGSFDRARLVTEWLSWREFSQTHNSIVVISEAFDSNYKYQRKTSRLLSVQKQTQGWWRISEIFPNCSRSTEYIFEAKNDNAAAFDKAAKFVNVTLLERLQLENVTGRNNLGVIIDPYDYGFQGKIVKPGNESSLGDAQVLKAISERYGKIVILSDGFSSNMKQQLPLDMLQGQVEIIQLFLPRTVKHNPNHTMLCSLVPLSTTILPFDTEKFTDHQIIATSANANDSKECKFGYTFPVSFCYFFSSLLPKKKEQVIAALSNSTKVIFYFDENKETVKLGAKRMFRQRVIIFEQCRCFMAEAISLNDRIGKAEVGFVMLRYGSSSDFYFDPLEMYNFILYRNMLKDWAVKWQTFVIMADTIDTIYENQKTSGEQLSSLEWWKHKLSRKYKNGSSDPEWIGKITNLLPPPNIIPMSTTTPTPSLDDHSKSKPKEKAMGDSRENEKIIMTAVTVSVITAFAVGGCIFFFVRRHYQQKLLSSTELREFFNGARHNDFARVDKVADIYKLCYEKSRYEIDSKSFSVDRTKILGSGEFGMVCSGKVQSTDGVFIDVAVKMVKAGKQHKTALIGLLSEIKVLAYLGKHENVIELIGASTSDVKNGNVLVLLELGQCGSLEKYLRKICPVQNEDRMVLKNEQGEMEMNEYANTSVDNKFILDPSLSNDLYRWSKEICNGMSFLSSKHVVHADLATRNILLNAGKTAKICDFGLSRRMYNYTNYVKQRQQPLPWKWMSPESLRRNEFSEKSDVWAYGITLWEIYSLGDMPYQGLSWDPNFSQMLERGFKMGEPKYNDRNMYTLMTVCWNTNPTNRPCFADLLLRFGDPDT